MEGQLLKRLVCPLWMAIQVGHRGKESQEREREGGAGRGGVGWGGVETEGEIICDVAVAGEMSLLCCAKHVTRVPCQSSL